MHQMNRLAMLCFSAAVLTFVFCFIYVYSR